MKHISRALLPALILFSSAVHAETPAKDAIWRNPQDSVHVRMHNCGSSRCGTVVWANDKAKADAARGGAKNLVGMELFRNFQKVNAKTWKGKVFVPDIDRTFSGTITLESPNSAVAKGCLLGKVGCKSQTWTRIP